MNNRTFGFWIVKKAFKNVLGNRDAHCIAGIRVRHRSSHETKSLGLVDEDGVAFYDNQIMTNYHSIIHFKSSLWVFLLCFYISATSACFVILYKVTVDQVMGIS